MSFVAVGDLVLYTSHVLSGTEPPRIGIVLKDLGMDEGSHWYSVWFAFDGRKLHHPSTVVGIRLTRIGTAKEMGFVGTKTVKALEAMA